MRLVALDARLAIAAGHRTRPSDSRHQPRSGVKRLQRPDQANQERRFAVVANRTPAMLAACRVIRRQENVCTVQETPPRVRKQVKSKAV